MSDMMDVLFATPRTLPRKDKPQTHTGGSKPPPPIPPLPYKPGDDSDMPPVQRRINRAMTEAYNDAIAKKAQESRPDFADDIDAMVARFVAEGWLYLDVKADEYRARQRRWREMTEEEKSWNA